MNVFDQLKAQMHDLPSTELPDNALVIDVRSPGEYSMGHVQDALNIPVEMFSLQNISAVDALKDKSITIIVYCASGMRSAHARTALMQMGYLNVVNGISAHETAQLTQKGLVR